jgi:hypothetical protein
MRGPKISRSTKMPLATPIFTKTIPNAVIGATIVSGASAYTAASRTTVLKKNSTNAA